MPLERDPRVYFAAERTMLAWIRTALAMMGFGFVVARFGLFLKEVGALQGGSAPNVSGSLWAGTLLVAFGVVVNVYAAISHARFTARFQSGDSDPRPSRFGVTLASLLAVLGMAMAAYLVARA